MNIEPESKIVQPEQGFVLKTKDMKSTRKVFLNVCHSDLVEAPHLKSLLEADGQQGVRIPISVGERIEESDKSGDPCDAYDVVIATSSYTQGEQDIEFKQMICQIAITAVAQKYKLDLDQRFTLPKLKYKGAAVRSQRIRIKKESQISEIFADQPSSHSNPPKVVDSGSASDSGSLPEFTIFYEREGEQPIDGLLLPCYQSVIESLASNLRSKVFGSEGEENHKEFLYPLYASKCVINIPLLEISSFKSVSISASSECLEICFTSLVKNYRNFHIWFPVSVIPETADANWLPDKKILQISIHVGNQNGDQNGE